MKFENHHNSFSLLPQWPPSLPSHCEKCGHPHDVRHSLEIGLGPAGRFLRKIAPWTTVVMLGLLFLTKLTFLNFGGNGGAMAFAAMVVLPAVLLHILGGVFGHQARVFCSRCRFESFYPVPNPLDNRISVD